MIAFVRGTVAAAGPEGAVVDVGGVGFAVLCTPATLATLRVGDPAHVPTSLVVREDSLTLYGFADDDERTVFELLQTASGVGPKVALAMLATHSPDTLRRAVAAEDIATLTRVPGIGPKGAKKIVLELKDRLGVPLTGAAPVPAPRGATPVWRDQVHAGLINLGWSGKDAEAAVDAVAADLEATEEIPPVATLLKSALRKLGPGGGL